MQGRFPPPRNERHGALQPAIRPTLPALRRPGLLQTHQRCQENEVFRPSLHPSLLSLLCGQLIYELCYVYTYYSFAASWRVRSVTLL